MKRKIIGFLTFLVLLVVLPVIVLQVQRQQETRQRAEGISSAHLALSTSQSNLKVGEDLLVNLYLKNPNNKDISAVDITLTYISDHFEIVSFMPNPPYGRPNIFSAIVNDVSVPGRVDYVGVNSSSSQKVNLPEIYLGSLILKAKAKGQGAVDVSNIVVTVQGETEPLAINPADNKPGTYTIGEPTPTPAITSVSQVISPTIASPVMCQAPQIISCGNNDVNSGTNPSWVPIDGATSYRFEWCYQNANFSEEDFKNGDCGFISESNPKVTIHFPGGAKNPDYKVRVRSESSNSCQPQPGAWSDIESCSILKLEKPLNTQVIIDSPVAFPGDSIPVKVKADSAVSYVDLYYTTGNEISVFRDGTYANSRSCYPRGECDNFYIPVVPDGEILNVFAASNYSTYLIKKNKPVEIYGKQVELLDTRPIIKIRAGISTLDLSRDDKYHLVGGLAIRVQGYRDTYVLIQAYEVKSIFIKHFSASVSPSETSPPGTLFTIVAKTDIDSNIEAYINGPTTKSFTLYDDGEHGDGIRKDGTYGYVFHSPESQVGTYTVNFSVNNRPSSIKVALKTNSFKDLCEPVTNFSGDIAKKINLVLIPNNYSENDLGQFQSEVIQRHMNFLFSKEPYFSNQNKFNIWFIKKVYNVDCSYEKAGNCFSEMEKNLVSVCPFADKAVVLDKNGGGGYAGLGFKIAVILGASYPTSGGGTMHEFGHSFGQLADEYNGLDWYSNSDTSAANCDIYACPKWCKEKSNYEEPQCSKIIVEQECKSKSYNGIKCVWFSGRKDLKCSYPYFSNINFGQACIKDSVCLYGCGGPNGYRSSNQSIMGDVAGGGNFEYNAVSKIQVQAVIDKLWKEKGNN